MKAQDKTNRRDRIRLVAIVIISLFVIATGIWFSINTFTKGDITGAIIGAVIAVTIVAFAIFTYRRGSKDLKEGYPVHDERSRRVIEKATYKACLVSLYLLLAIGFLSEDVIKFRDVSQAISVAVGGMAILLLIFWVYYNKREI